MNYLKFLAPFLLSASACLAQTITWTAATNPHVVSGTYTVPAGQTLIMEAGVIVSIQANSTLQVNGQLIGNGTAGNRITINSASNFSSALDVVGTADLHFTEVRAKVVPDTNGVLLFADCNFSGNGTVFNGQVLQLDNSRAPYLQFDRCAFQGNGANQSASLYVAYCTVVLRNTSFTNGSYCNVYPAYLFLDNVTSDRSSDAGLTLGSDSDLFLNNISVTNAAQSGLRLAGDTRNGTNVLIGPNTTLQGNVYPIHLTIAGLYPESTVPAIGNTNNLIHVSDFASAGAFWPKFAIPYYNDGSPLVVGEGLRIFPGVTVKMAPFSYMSDQGFGNGMRAFGTKAEPITFERANAGSGWYDLHADRTEGGRMRYCIIDGNTDGVNGGAWRLENCIFRNNGIGTSGGALVSGSQYLNNGIGHNAGASSSLNNAANPNSFEGNGTGVNYSPDARNCWWGSPTGPRTPSNPGGTGDPIGNQQTVFQPFLTARPDYSDGPPEVNLLAPSFQQEAGNKVTLRWTSSDDVGITSHKILFSPVGNFPGSFSTVATLPGNQQTYEWTVPNIGFTVNGNNAYIKVVAVDTTGKESFDEAEVVIPTNNIQGTVTFNIAPGQTFQPGEILPDGFFVPNIEPYMTRVEFYIEEVGSERRKLYSRGANGGGIPFFSSDSVRFVISYGDTTNNRKYWYSPLFKVRPDTHLNDNPPTIAVSAPQAGQTFAPGSVIPISWTASDDEGLRGFDIVASFDGARTWQPIVRDLPGTARSYNWQLAPGTGSPDVRLLVVARDWRFQTSSDGAARVFATNGTAAPALQMTSAVSRKTHGSAGTYDINLPLTGTPGVEGRSGGNHTIVATFSNPLTTGTASVSAGAGSVSSTSFSGNTLIVNLASVADRQTMTVTLSNVTDSSGQTMPPQNVPVTLLLGDVNGSGTVTSSDVSQVKASAGTVTSANFRADVIANGSINSSDVGAVKAASGGGPAALPMVTRR